MPATALKGLVVKVLSAATTTVATNIFAGVYTLMVVPDAAAITPVMGAPAVNWLAGFVLIMGAGVKH